MDYNFWLNKVNEQIENITLSKEKETEIYFPIFKTLYGDLDPSGIVPSDPFYFNKCTEMINYLTSIRSTFSTNKEFYYAVATMFARAYIPAMVREFNIDNNELVEQLYNIALGDGIKIFDRGEAKKYVSSFGSELNGDVGAFKFRDKICFTPDNECSSEVISEEQSIVNAGKMLSSMIHETVHFFIDVMKDEHFVYDDLSKLTSGGSYLNEGLVEMYSLDFAKKYNFLHLPALYYINNVELCRSLQQFYGDEKFYELVSSKKYDELIPEELIENYKQAERVRYFSRRGIEVDINNIDITNQEKKTF